MFSVLGTHYIFFDPHHMNGRIFKLWPPFFFHMFIMTPSMPSEDSGPKFTCSKASVEAN